MRSPDRHGSNSWRARAEECRAIAGTFANPETRRRMEAVAAGYEKLAEQAEQREAEQNGAPQRMIREDERAGPDSA